jgi:hypothetical protein
MPMVFFVIFFFCGLALQRKLGPNVGPSLSVLTRLRLGMTSEEIVVVDLDQSIFLKSQIAFEVHFIPVFRQQNILRHF